MSNEANPQSLSNVKPGDVLVSHPTAVREHENSIIRTHRTRCLRRTTPRTERSVQKRPPWASMLKEQPRPVRLLNRLREEMFLYHSMRPPESIQACLIDRSSISSHLELTRFCGRWMMVVHGTC
jgi:hypothetical protein